MSGNAGAPNASAIGRIAASARTGALWSILQLLATRLLGFVSILVLARLLAPDDFGVVAAIAVLLSFLQLAGDAGMKASVIYEQESSVTVRVQTAFTLSVISSAALTGIGVALAPLLAGFFGVEEHAALFRLAAVNILLTGIGNVPDGILQRNLTFRPRLAAEALRTTLSAVVSIGMALAGYEAASLVWGMTAGTAVWMVVVTSLARMRPTLRIDLAAARSMGRYGASSAALAAIAAFATRLDAVVIGRFLGARALGIYTVAYRLPEIAIQAVAWQLSLVIFPSLSRKRVTDEQGLPAATVRLIRLQALYVLPVAAGISVLSVPLVGVLFGPTWSEASRVLVPISVLSAVLGVTFPLGDLLKATGRQNALVALNVVSIPLLVGSIAALTSSGLTAVAWARAGTTALFGIGLVAVASKIAAVPAIGVLRALGPGCVAALGVTVGAGGVRLLWDAVSVPAVIVAAAVGTSGAAVLVTLCAPIALAELRRMIRMPRVLKQRASTPVTDDTEGEVS